MGRLFLAALSAIFGATLVASEAKAAAWTLTNTLVGCNAAIGYVLYGPPNGTAVPVDGGYRLVGDDLPHYVVRSTYTTIAEMSGDYTFAWAYYNYEPFGFGSYEDPAGYVIGDEFTKLIVDLQFLCFAGDPLCTVRAQNGIATLSVAAGQRFGFYVDSLDGGYGPGEITFRAIPEPSQWALTILGFAAIGWSLRRHRRQAA